ncbi:MAG: chromosome segregation protein SMC [Candidatus Thorarchaeota archaeon]
MVYIDKLVCKGFKSFGRETVTIKLDPGFTCIVGPNGSGKSNVIDALLFVLGQLSAKTLRASVFSDLLYSPPKPGMPPKAKSAVVQLHFNNKDRKLAVDADKVVIERELDETGKSVCRVNGRVVTRSAVLDLLGSIGVDPNGYNLVLQGEIAQMVKVSPNDRRKLIEEIAGISAYDEQKERALKKLSESEANLSKVDTQLQERRRHLEKLEEEREDAMRYTNIQNQMKTIKIDIIAWKIIKSQNRIETISETLTERAEEAERLRRELEELEEKSKDVEEEIEAIDDEIDRITGGDSSRISEQLGVVTAAVGHAQSNLERARADLEQKIREMDELVEVQRSLREQIDRNKEMIQEHTTHLEETETELGKVDRQITMLQETLDKEQDNYYELQRRLQTLNSEMISLDESVSEIRSSIKSDERELGIAYEEMSDAKESLVKTKEQLEKLRIDVPREQEELQQGRELEASKRLAVEDIDRQLSTLQDEISESEKIVRTTRDELIKMQARRDALKEAEEAFLRRKRAVARVLQLRDTGEVEGIYGTVAELGTIDSEYAVALEIAGGNRLTHIVVEDEDVATQCIEILKRDHAGRATFIPLNRIKTRSPGHIPDDERVIGYAMDLVAFDPKVQPAFEFVFSNTIVTEDFATAKRMGFKGWRAVSLEGDLVERSGLISGGHYQRGSTGLSLKIEDKSPEIKQKLQGLEEILAGLIAKRQDLMKSKKQLEREIQDLSKVNYRSGIQLENHEETLKNLEMKKEQLQGKVESTAIRIKALEDQIADLRKRDEEFTEKRERVRAERDECNEQLATSKASQISQDIRNLTGVAEHLKRKRDDIQKEISALRVALEERLKPKAEEIELRMQALSAVIPNLEAEVGQLESRLASKEQEVEVLREKREKIEETVKDHRVRQIHLKEEARNIRFRHEEIRDAQTSNEKAVYRLQSEQSRLQNEIVASLAELKQMADADDELAKRDKMRELTYKEIEDLEEKLRALNRELEAMGPVNLKALTDYDAEKERYEEIVEKKTKLEEEHKEILRFMEELEREKTQKFLQVYNEIADNFSKVFAKLSPGGEASLMLENPEHPLMGGITVRSKPRGKDIVSLDAMSGGEKTLTGLALIFAIQLHSPASFYVFDEIDAALDDVNAHNVALLISEMAKSSQFIVVSLRDVTVRKADRLVGVTNQDGISRIVAVDLEEVAGTA